MYSCWFKVTVVLLWLSTMSWLVVEKFLPPLLKGDPPSYRTILQAQRRQPLVAWKLKFNERRIGWALSTTVPLPKGLTEIRSRVHFDRLPLGELTQGWTRALLRLFDQSAVSKLQLDARSVMTIDSLDRLSGFNSLVRIEPGGRFVRLIGTIEGPHLKLLIRTGEREDVSVEGLSPRGLMVDALSPQAQLPGLREGQTWTVPVYSPLRPRAPVEILQATVEGIEPILWNGRPEETWLVVYRADSGSGFSSEENHRGRLWVRRDGIVLKQQVTFFGSTLTFERLPDEQAAALERRVSDEEREEKSG